MLIVSVFRFIAFESGYHLIDAKVFAVNMSRVSKKETYCTIEDVM